MEGEREEQGEITQSETSSTQADEPTQSCSEESHEPQTFQEPEQEEVVSGACDGEEEHAQVEEDLCISEAETSPQETLISTHTQDHDHCLPLSPLPREEESSPPSVSSHPSDTQKRLSEPCWYCLRSLDSEGRPGTPEQEDSNSLSSSPSSGQRVSYQTDPRPHFGVACSSHSTCSPLWGSEGPCWGQRNQEVPGETQTCPHCHLALTPDTLLWHEAKCLLFEGQKNSKN
ncbi:hypothetical protein CgunFtcFv8_002752 [Champsocephalus gunnari]|uniref:Uncharacterized protein n=1 Tax=Champsocephalus gunnari TaxID=52237 RepID=A0AAN8DBV3_CHAGU|nr:hypothetical protein CgunFtcFv8_002752 [Champsocephalus gunnari]